MSVLVVVVHHLPAPQGSKIRTNYGVRDDNPATKPFRDIVTAEALTARKTAGWEPRPGPVVVDVVFTMPRPRGHYGTGRNATKVKASAPSHPATKPDSDKLGRAVLDGLDDAGVYLDDGQVFDLHIVKAYPHGHLDALDTPGAVITITQEDT